MTKQTKAHLAVLATNIIYGANFTIAKLVMPIHIQPAGFILLRISVAGLLFFFCYVFISGVEPILRKDWWRVIACGLFGVAINQLLFFEGLNKTSNINAALIMTATPLLVMLAASLILKEKLNLVRVIGIALGIAGACTLILFGKNVASGGDTWLGNLLVLINASSYAIYMVLVKPLMKKYKPLTIIFYVFLIGFLAVLPFGFTQLSTVSWSKFSALVWGATAFVVIGTTFFAYLLNNYGLSTLSPSVVSAYIYLQPIIATIISLFITHEQVYLLQVVACALIFIGLYLVNRGSLAS
ncbi:MAG: hypothetical protein RIQ89_1680 [Bacteroidota bacterium]